MRINRKIALVLALCLLAGMFGAGLAEDDIVMEYAEEAATPAESAGEDNGLWVEGEDAPTFDAPAEALPDAPAEVEAPAASGRAYARTICDETPVYANEAGTQLLALLAADETVLVTADRSGRVSVALNIDGAAAEGWMDDDTIVYPGDGAIDAALDAAEGVALYLNDINWPLLPLSADSYTGPFDLMAANYRDIGNETEYTINGKTIHASQFPDTGAGNCWAWAQKVYKELWGCQFSSDFEGRTSTGLNLVRNLGDEDRLLTPEHLKYFIQNTIPGATLRVQSCPADCPKRDQDGLSCGHKGHSLIVVDKNSDGVFTMDSHSNSQHTRFYSWQGFCNSWKNYVYVKYIKWPNAPALPPTQTIDGVSVHTQSATYRVRATASGAKVYSKPSDGSVVARLTYPATFAAAKESVSKIDGVYWAYGVAQGGATGWLPLNDSVANVNDVIPATGVALSQSALVVQEGKSATLTAAVAPADATNQAVSWTSSDPSVATVKDGVVTGVSHGTATITATTADGGKTAACKVGVSKAVAEITLSKTGGNGTVKLAPGQQLQLNAKFAVAKGWKLKSVKSSKSSVAVIDKSGIVTAKGEGKATITVTAKNGKKATLNVVVSDPTKVAKVALSKKGTVKLKAGATLKLYAAVQPSTAVSKLVWKSSNPKVAAVDDEGNVTALKKGAAYVGAMAENGKYATVKIKVG